MGSKLGRGLFGFGDGRFPATTISTSPVTEWLDRRQYLERPWFRSSLGAFFGDGGERFSATTIVTALVTESLERRQYLERLWVRSSVGAFLGDGGERFSATTSKTPVLPQIHTRTPNEVFQIAL